MNAWSRGSFSAWLRNAHSCLSSIALPAAAAGNKDVTSKVFLEMNHLFVHDPVGFPGNYAKLVNPRVEPEVVGAVAEWLLKRMR